MKNALKALSLMALAMTIGTPAMAGARPADLVLWHGTVLTVDAHDRVAQAIAVRDGRIVIAGSDSQVRRLIGKRTKVVDLNGRTATPGLIDSHGHFLAGALQELYDIDLTHTTSLSDLLAAVKGRAATAKPGEWLSGGGWNESVLAEHRAPTLAEIDAVSGDHPLWLINATGHYGLANSAALKVAGIDDATPDPASGVIIRDASGHATGILKELAQALVSSHLPPRTADQRQAAILHVLDEMHAEGMTGGKDAKLTGDDWDAYAAVAKDGRLDAHICPLIFAGNTLDTARTALVTIRRAQGQARTLPGHDLTVCGAKIFLDGSAMARTAWMDEDYPSDNLHPAPTGHGFAAVAPDTYGDMVRLFVSNGISVGTHVIGDRAIDTAADTYAAALAASPHPGLRLSLIHAHAPSQHALSVMADLQKRYDAGDVETQAGFLWWLGDALPGAFGLETSQHLMPLATYKARGILFSGGSDYPVTPLAARYGIWASVARSPLKGVYGPHPFGTAEAIDVRAALRSYTVSAAHQLFIERETGSLEAGKWADIAVWDRDPYTVPTDALKDMRCVMTLYKGKVVFKAE